MLLVLIAIVIYRRKQPKIVDNSGLSDVTVRCPEGQVEQPIERIWFRCSGEHLGINSPIACKNHLTPISFEEMKTGYRETGSGAAIERIPLLRPRLSLPEKLRPENKDFVLYSLMGAKCALCGRIIQPYCRCQGEDKPDHRLYFDFTLSDIVCLTGPVSAGKTVYFHVLKHYLEKKYTKDYKLLVRLEPQKTREHIHDSLTKMINEKIIPHPTERGEQWEVRFTVGPAESGWPTKPIKLFMYDTSGEILWKMEFMQQHFEFFSFSDSLVLFLDPYSISELAKKCHPQDDERNKGKQNLSNINKILEDIIAFLGERAYPNFHKYPVNLAVAITKCDEFMGSCNNEELIGLLGTVHPSGAKKPNLEPLDKISSLFRDWLSHFEELEDFINKADSAFAKVGYFPISSLGTGVIEEPVVEIVEKSSGEFISRAQALDPDANDTSVSTTQSDYQAPATETRITIRKKYQGDLNPLYLDYPILWLQKHRRRK